MNSEQMFWNWKMLGHLVEFGIFYNVYLTQAYGSLSWGYD